MPRSGATRTTFTSVEISEIGRLLDVFPTSRLAVQRTTVARLRDLGLALDGSPTRTAFEAALTAGDLRVSDLGAARAAIQPHPSGNVFRVAVGVKGHPVPENWSAFDQRYQWFGQKPQQVTSGAHLFALAVDRWRSAVVGLYEAVSAGADRLPGSPDPDRWPWALGVRPLAAIPPPEGKRIDRLYGPQSGLPTSIPSDEALSLLYDAVASSPPPPGPKNREQEIQLLDPIDVVDDVLEAVRSLGKEARRAPVIGGAIQIGEWNAEELAARAWSTGTGEASHVRRVVGQALDAEVGLTRRLTQIHGVYSETGSPSGRGFGVSYRRAGDRVATHDVLPGVPDLAKLDRATRRHMELQDKLAEELRQRGIVPKSPGTWQPQFDLAFEHRGERFVVEVKTSAPVTTQQVRLGVGQVLEYRHLLMHDGSPSVNAVLLLETAPPEPWEGLCANLDIEIVAADRLGESLTSCLDV